MSEKEHYLCGYEQSPEHRANGRIAAFLRETKIRRHVSVHGTVYCNITQAAKATGLSPRSVARYANNDQHSDFFFVASK